MIRRTTLCLMFCAMLLGCNLGEPDRSKVGHEEIQKELTREPEWSKVPALRRIPVSSDLFLARSVRPPMPSKAANKEISLRFNKGNATINDLIGIMDYEGIPVIIRPSGGSGATSGDIGDMVLPFRRYDGTLGNLVKKIGRSLDLSIWWENDALLVSDRDRYVVSVPQQQDVIDTVVGELEDFGAEDISPSLYGGRIIYSARPQANEEIIVPYLNGLAGNLAEITLQVAIVQLQVTDVSQRGIDWSSFQLQFGDPAAAAAAAKAATGATNLVNGVQGALGLITGTSDVSTATGTSGTISGTATGKIGNTGVGISGAIQYLSQFGRTSTRQMVELRTLAGQPVQLVSSQSIPYVKGLSSAAPVGAASGAAAAAGTVTTSVDTSTVDTGLNMSFTPYYDSLMALVVVDVNIQVSSFLGFATLSYGAATPATGSGSTATPGQAAPSISQPKTSKNQITDIVRIPAGEVVILGGLHEEDKADDRTAPFDTYDTLGSRKDSNTTTLTFFIMRPVVTIFDPKGATVNTTLPGDGIDTSEKVSSPDKASLPEPAAVATLPPGRDKKRSTKSVEDLYSDDNKDLPSVSQNIDQALAKPVSARPGATKPINSNKLEKVLEGGFAGATGLETQGGL